MPNKTKEPVIFGQGKKYFLEKELAQGGCGKAVLLYDEDIDEHFVCKKFEPPQEEHRAKLYSEFVQEVKILYKINHLNIVRVFNYYLYPDKKLGYIFMEHIQGENIFDYSRTNPERINLLFQQTIEGFAHLEKTKILHRDIRPQNILVSEDGIVKIIDFGFGKMINSESDFDTNLRLNWPCDLPEDISNRIYDFGTEVYFVGKLFEKIISDTLENHFQYSELLVQMCAYSRSSRTKSFCSIDHQIKAGEFDSLSFDNHEIYCYRNFAESLSKIIFEIEKDTTYSSIPDEILTKLEHLYSKTRLEEYLPKNTLIIDCFLDGAYKYSTTSQMPVEDMDNFIKLLKSCPSQKKSIVLNNLFTRLDTIKRFVSEDIDIPF